MKSLSFKTLVLMVVLFGVIAGAASWLAATELRRNLLAEYRTKAAAVVTSLAESDVDLLVNRNLERLQSTIDQYLETAGVAYVMVEDSSGEVVAHTFVPGVPKRVREVEAEAHGLSGEITFVSIEVPNLGSVLHASKPILMGHGGQAHVGMDLEVIEERIVAAVIKVQLLMLAIFLLSVVVAGLLVRRITRPLVELSQSARRLGRLGPDDWGQEDLGTTGLSSRALGRGDEIGTLARSFRAMEKRLHESVRDLRETTAAKERLEGELEIARALQQSMLPTRLPEDLDSEGVDLQAGMTPAREVGGDFYDYFRRADGALVVAVGDVSDKGMPAALFMAMTATLLRAIARETKDPAEVMTRLNRELCEDEDNVMFVTIFLGVLDPSTGELMYCNAGHNPPYVLASASSSIEELSEEHGMAVGIDFGAEYQSQSRRLRQGETLFAFTDGVTEAFNGAGEMFGDERLSAVLGQSNVGSLSQINKSVLEAVESFVEGAAPSDDLTILSLVLQSAPQ